MTKKRTVVRNSGTGKFDKKSSAKTNPKGTQTETIERRNEKKAARKAMNHLNNLRIDINLAADVIRTAITTAEEGIAKAFKL